MKAYVSRILSLISHVTDEKENTNVIKSSFANVRINATDEGILAVADVIRSLLVREIDTVRISEAYEYDV